MFGQDSNFYQAMLLARFELIEGWRALDDYLPAIRSGHAPRTSSASRSSISLPDNRTVGVLVPTGPAKHRRGSSPRHAALTAAMRWTLRDGRDALSSGRCRLAEPTRAAGAAPPVDRTVLPNGFRLLVIRQPHLPMVVVSALVDAGSRFDPHGKEGLASLTANLLTEGHRKAFGRGDPRRRRFSRREAVVRRGRRLLERRAHRAQEGSDGGLRSIRRRAAATRSSPKTSSRASATKRLPSSRPKSKTLERSPSARFARRSSASGPYRCGARRA